MTLQNDLLLKALKGETVQRPPVWMMRQAGRFLPDYMKLKEKYDFFTRVETPELAAEITVMPVNQIGVDAAILFSDILVVPQAMGLQVLMEERKGPSLPDPIKTVDDLKRICVPDVHDRLHYVMGAIKATKQSLNGAVPLIGFAGAPWTLLCYMVEGKGSKTFDQAKQFCYTQPELAHTLLQMITDTTIAYLKAQVEAGVNCVQVFDSWGGLLDKEDFAKYSLAYIDQIVKALRPLSPVTVFAKGVWHSLTELENTGASALGLDWANTPGFARANTCNITLQGNYDPAKLLQSPAKITKDVHQMIDAFGVQRYIVNLGHGILPNVPVENGKAFVEAVKSYKA